MARKQQQTTARMDRAMVRTLGAEAEQAVQAVAKKYGLVVKQGRHAFDAGSASIKLDFAVVGDGGVALTPERQALVRYGAIYGVADLADTVFTWQGTQYKVTGLNARAQKMPLLCERNDGKMFRFGIDTVRAALSLAQNGRK